MVRISRARRYSSVSVAAASGRNSRARESQNSLTCSGAVLLNTDPIFEDSLHGPNDILDVVVGQLRRDRNADGLASDAHSRGEFFGTPAEALLVIGMLRHAQVM